MCTNTDDVDDEYLDDPISLVAIEDIKTEICVDEDTVDPVIDISSDEEETCTSAYGKKTFVLPVTFFDVSKNVRLLNKCKPLSIRVVDCKQYPTYYTEYQEKRRNVSDECSVEVDSKCKSNKETNRSNVSVEDTVIITSTREKTDKKQEGEQKRRIHSDSFYEKLKIRKENRKQIALKCKNLSQVDFKRNVGLVGLKITDTIFKQIVESEKALISSKCNSAENNKNKSEIPSITTKPVAPNSICKDKYDSVAEKALIMKKSVSVEDNSKGNNKKYLSEPEKLLLSTTKTNTSDDKLRENITRVSECLSIKRIPSTGNKYYDKKESDKDKANIEPINDHADKNECKEKNYSIAAKDSIKTKMKLVDLECKRKMLTGEEITSIESICKSTTATVDVLEESKKQEFESNKYMKKIGAVLDNLGTSVIPLTGITNDYVPKHVSPQDNSEAKASISQIDNLDSNNEGSQIRCSLKILSNNVIKKVLKLKKVKSDPKNEAKTVFQQIPKESHSKVEQIATNINLNQSKHNGEKVCVSSDKDKMQIKRPSSKEVVKHSDGTKQVEKALVKDASSDQAGPNSPVIPCTTISVRAETPKLAETKSTLVQKQSGLPNVSTTNKTDVTNSKCTAISKHNEPVVPNATIKSNCDTKGTFLCNQNTIFSSKKVTEFKYPKSHTLPALSSVQNNVPAMIEPSLSHHNLSKMNPTKGPDLANAHMKPATSAGILTNGLVNNQANPNQQTNTPLSSRTPSKFSGHNAIIFRKSISTPSSSRQLLNYPPLHQGQPIQTVLNRFQNQPIPPGPRPMRFNHPPWRLPPPPPTTPPNNVTQVTPQRFISPRVPPNYLRGMEMGLHHWRFYNPPLPPINRPPLSVPRFPRPQVNEDSLIGNTANGDLIKKINIPVVPNTVNDKQKMLAELNNAILSPELTNNQDNDLKRKADNIPIDAVTPKHSKPGPLSKKIKTTSDEYEVNFPDNLSPNNGYSPPILPIFPYQQSFKIFSQNDSEKAAPVNKGKNCTPVKRTKSTGSNRKLDKDHKILSQRESGNQDKAKKISFEDYRKRVVDRKDVRKIRKYRDAKDVADDHNQDQGYDSDSTIKL